jgi:hypothetical protein
MWHMGRFLSGARRRIIQVPEHNPRAALAWLLLGCLVIAPYVLFSWDTDDLAHLAVGLYVFVDAVLHLMPDELQREKVALRITGLVFLLAVALPLLIMGLIAHASGTTSWILVVMPVLVWGPVLVVVLCLQYASRRQKQRRP